jgi:hypothetical protein
MYAALYVDVFPGYPHKSSEPAYAPQENNRVNDIAERSEWVSRKNPA